MKTGPDRAALVMMIAGFVAIICGVDISSGWITIAGFACTIWSAFAWISMGDNR